MACMTCWSRSSSTTKCVRPPDAIIATRLKPVKLLMARCSARPSSRQRCGLRLLCGKWTFRMTGTLGGGLSPQDRVVEEAEGVRDAVRGCAVLRRGVGLREVEVLVAQRVEDVVGELRRARVRGALARARCPASAMFSPGDVLVQVLDVADLLAAVDRDRRRQSAVKNSR